MCFCLNSADFDRFLSFLTISLFMAFHSWFLGCFRFWIFDWYRSRFFNLHKYFLMFLNFEFSTMLNESILFKIFSCFRFGGFHSSEFRISSVIFYTFMSFDCLRFLVQTHFNGLFSCFFLLLSFSLFSFQNWYNFSLY